MADFNPNLEPADFRPDSQGDGELSGLQQEALTFNAQPPTDGNITGPAGAEIFEFDGKKFIEDNYGSEQKFLEAQPGELRQQLGLPANATSQDVFEKMAKDTKQILGTASPEMSREILDSLQLHNSKAPESDILDALVRREMRDSRLTGSPSYQQLENAMHQRSLDEVRSGRMPIDYD